MMTTKTPAQARKEMQKKGFTLTEIAIVLGIMGLVLGAIWVAAAGVYNNQRINQANTAVMQVLQGVRTLYGQQASIPGGAADLSQNMVNAGVIPTNLIRPGAVAQPFMLTPWGQPMYVGTNANGDAITIVLTGMTTALCVGVVSQIFGPSHDRTLDNSSVTLAAAPANGAGVALTGVFTATVVPTTSAAVGTPGVVAGNGTGCTTAASGTLALRLQFGLAG